MLSEIFPVFIAASLYPEAAGLTPPEPLPLVLLLQEPLLPLLPLLQEPPLP